MHARARPRRARGADGRHAADPGRVRHRQGGHRQGRPPREHARGAPVRGGELRRGARDPARVRALRLHARRLHRRRRQQARALRGSGRRHALPGRDRRDAGRAPGEAPARAPERRGAAARRDPAHHHRRARDRGHPRRPRGADQPGQLPRGPLLSAQRHPGRAAAAARPPRGHPGAGRALPRAGGRQARPRAPPVARRRSSACSATRGRATCASWRTPSSARPSSPARETVEPDDLPPHVSAGLQLGPSPALPRQTTLGRRRARPHPPDRWSASAATTPAPPKPSASAAPRSGAS